VSIHVVAIVGSTGVVDISRGTLRGDSEKIQRRQRTTEVLQAGTSIPLLAQRVASALPMA
jgi:hypothetical protein